MFSNCFRKFSEEKLKSSPTPTSERTLTKHIKVFTKTSFFRLLYWIRLCQLMFHSLHGFHSPSRGIFSTSNSNQLISTGLILLSDSCARFMQQVYEINNKSTFKNINFLFPLKAITVRHVFINGWIFIIVLAIKCSLEFLILSCFHI